MPGTGVAAQGSAANVALVLVSMNASDATLRDRQLKTIAQQMMYSASVRQPGSGRHLQLTSNGLLRAIKTGELGEKAFDQVRWHGGDRYGKKRTAATVLSTAATSAFRARLEPLTHVGIEANAVHVVVKSPAQATA